jgi:hypothetical protein
LQALAVENWGFRALEFRRYDFRRNSMAYNKLRVIFRPEIANQWKGVGNL